MAVQTLLCCLTTRALVLPLPTSEALFSSLTVCCGMAEMAAMEALSGLRGGKPLASVRSALPKEAAVYELICLILARQLKSQQCLRALDSLYNLENINTIICTERLLGSLETCKFPFLYAIDPD